MKKLLTLFLALTMIGSFSGYAQQIDPKIQNIKVGLFTERMNLTGSQAQQFWPKYNQYENERRGLNKQIKQLKDDHGNASQNVDKIQQLEMSKAQLRGKYKTSFLQVISTDQLNKMYGAEDEFKRRLLDRLSD